MKEIDFSMIKLDLKDLLKSKIYIVRYGGNQVYKTSNLNTLKRLLKALKTMNITNYHIYKLDISKENL